MRSRPCFSIAQDTADCAIRIASLAVPLYSNRAKRMVRPTARKAYETHEYENRMAPKKHDCLRLAPFGERRS
jgi:hypothetical protein